MSRLQMIRNWAIVVVVLLLVGCARESGSSSRNLRFGVALPLTGSMAEYGENGREGLTLAKEEIEKSNQGTTIELVVQDTQDAPSGTVAAVRRLIDVDQVKFLIGGLTSSGVLAAAPYAQEHGVLFFTPAASAPGIPEIGDLVIRNWPSDVALATLYGKYAYAELGARALAILQVSNDYGNTNAAEFRRSFESAGGRVVFTRSFTQGSTDFRTLVTQLKTAGEFDTLLVIAYPDEYRAVFTEISAQRIKPSRILTTDTFFSPELLQRLGASAEGTYCAVAAKPGSDYEPRNRFIATYRARFKKPDGTPKDPGLVSDTAYDALHLLFNGITSTDGTPTAVSKWLLNQRNYQGAAGPTTFTSTGDLEGGISIQRVSQGGFQLVR